MADDFYSLKGFVSYGALTNNDSGVISPIGELSLRSSTYAKDRALYVGTTDTSPATSAELTVFSSQSIEDDPVSVPAPVAAFLVEVSQWVYQMAVDGVFLSSTDSFRDAFTAQFTDETKSLVVGMMVTNGTIWMPSSITFFLQSDEIFGGSIPVGMEEVRIRLWFSDTHFRQSFDEYDIAFIGPVETLDDLFGYPLAVVNLLSQRTPPELTMKIAEVAGNSPYTVVNSYNFKYYHLGDATTQTPAYWTAVIWSEFGNNLDTLKIDLADWILGQSTHTREEWIEIFPDIFATTEFIITPFWNQYAIPNLTLDHAMYSPTVKVDDAAEFMQATAAGTGYTEEFVDDHMTFLSIAYKSIAAIACGGPENREEKYYLYNWIPDYLDVPTSSIDFDRMSAETRFWAMKIFAMLQVAENMTELTDIPSGMYRVRRLNRDGEEILYVGASIFDVQYLITSKKSLNTMYPPQDRNADPIEMLPDPSVSLTTLNGSKHFTLNVSAIGGTAPYTFSAVSSDIETGGTINPTTGFLDVTFLEFGTNSVHVTVTDFKGYSLTETYTVVSADGE